MFTDIKDNDEYESKRHTVLCLLWLLTIIALPFGIIGWIWYHIYFKKCN